MKNQRCAVVFAVAFVALFALREAKAQSWYADGVEVRGVSDFYDPLSAFGQWVQVDSYGWCWYPTYVGSDWRPYSNGHWLWSDNGWYWTSEEPWSWACYHYGRWAWDSYYGWLWVPGLEWAPAWVCWRENDDYVGWAPLPPDCDFGPRTVIYAEQVVVPSEAFVFVEHRHFCDRIGPRVIVINNTIINRTVNITKITRADNVVVNEGPDPGAIGRTNPGKVHVVPPSQPRQRRPLPGLDDGRIVQHQRATPPQFARNPRRDGQTDRPVVVRTSPPQRDLLAPGQKVDRERPPKIQQAAPATPAGADVDDAKDKGERRRRDRTARLAMANDSR